MENETPCKADTTDDNIELLRRSTRIAVLRSTCTACKPNARPRTAARNTMAGSAEPANLPWIGVNNDTGNNSVKRAEEDKQAGSKHLSNVHGGEDQAGNEGKAINTGEGADGSNKRQKIIHEPELSGSTNNNTIHHSITCRALGAQPAATRQQKTCRNSSKSVEARVRVNTTMNNNTPAQQISRGRMVCPEVSGSEPQSPVTSPRKDLDVNDLGHWLRMSEKKQRAKQARRNKSPSGQTIPTQQSNDKSKPTSQESEVRSATEGRKTPAPVSPASENGNGIPVQATLQLTLPVGRQKPTSPASEHSSDSQAHIDLTEDTIALEERTYWADGTPRFVVGPRRKVPIVTNSQGRRMWRRPPGGSRPELAWRESVEWKDPVQSGEVVRSPK